MRRWLAPLILVLMVLPGLGCAKLRNKPVKAVPEGTVVFAFNRKVRGPVELTLDGVRVPVIPVAKNKPARSLLITGLAPGKHRFFLSSPRDAFGPDQGEFEVAAGQGTRVITFVQAFNAVLYGKAEDLPTAEGIPGVKARLEP